MTDATQFDPALKQLLLQATGSPLGKTVSEEVGARQVPVVVRLVHPESEVEGLHIIARFGSIVTGRVQLDHLVSIRQHPNVASLKASATMGVALAFSVPEIRASAELLKTEFPTAGITGRGVIIAFLDWGCDFAHANLRDPQGGTRLLCLWDQRGGPQLDSPTPFGYGRLFHKEQIDAALAQVDPYAALGYDPMDADDGTGTHCTHVMDIAAGNGQAPGSSPGVAPEAGLICVHLKGEDTQPEDTLGDSVRVLEALRFIADWAGDRPLVINLSLGKTGGPHDQTPLVTQALDYLVEERSGCVVVMSAGNYFSANIHSSGVLHTGEQVDLHWNVKNKQEHMAEMEVWYAGSDRFSVELIDPLGNSLGKVALGEDQVVRDGEKIIASLYHRREDPNNHDHQVDIFLWPEAPNGVWVTRLFGEDVQDGRYHAWIERARSAVQARFEPESATPTTTSGTICNGLKMIAVGAYDARLPSLPLGHFSSAGPTRDGRSLPTICAPGVAIRAARSSYITPIGRVMNDLTVKSGTSMATPHVSGVCALMFEAAGDARLTADQTREILASTARTEPSDEVYHRYGAGRVDALAAIRRVREVTQPLAPITIPIHEELEMDGELSITESLEPERTEVEIVIPEKEEEIFQPEQEVAAEIDLDEKELHPLQRTLTPLLPQLLIAQGERELHRTTETGEPIYGKSQPLFFAPNGLHYRSGSGQFHYHAADFVYNTAYQVGYDVPVYPINSSSPDAGEAYLNLTATFRAMTGENGDLGDYLHRFFEVVAAPGDPVPSTLRAGDLLLHGPQPGAEYGHLAIIVDPQLRDAEDPFLIDRNYTDGFGLHCISAGLALHDRSARYGRTIADAQGNVHKDCLVIRLKANTINPLRVQSSLKTDPDYERRVMRAHWDQSLRQPEDFPIKEDTQADTIQAGKQRVEHVPLIRRAHLGDGPDLYLFWNDIPRKDQNGNETSSIDVVVHLHGFATCGERIGTEDPQSIPILDRLVSNSRLPFVNRTSKAILDRAPATLGILPRGKYFDFKGDAGYTFPALATEDGLSDLVEWSLRFFERQKGFLEGQLKKDRLILIAHSGGGKWLLKILEHSPRNDPDEIYILDALYASKSALTPLTGWLHRHSHSDAAQLRKNALAVLFTGETEAASLEVQNAICKELAADSPMHKFYRVARATTHCNLPSDLGWRLLKDAATALPKATELSCS